MLHLFLEEKQKIELHCKKCFSAVGSDDDGFACSDTITTALIRTLQFIDICPVSQMHIEKLVDGETKLNTGRINLNQFTAVVRRVFVEAFYPKYSEVLAADC